MKFRVTYPAMIYFDVEGDNTEQAINNALGELVGDAYDGFNLPSLADGRVYANCNAETGAIEKEKIKIVLA